MPINDSHQNRLIHEKSPYLLQHAHNPVDWYPWGEEAFAAARKEDKPIFLSIGYSTCHWCHVMERESFEVLDVAAVINDYFIPVKVDREERPDIDNIYMTVVTAMTGQGGWPLTLFLTPDQKPFFGGTYFPPQAKFGSPGLLDIMQAAHEAWTNKRDDLIQSGESITNALRKQMAQEGEKQALTEDVLKRAFSEFEKMYDPYYGGFSNAPKFPASHNLSFLLRYWKRTGEVKALDMVEVTLKKMARGGMYDHVGGGFHRYSTDQQWQVPHFEKMLYDQALLARTYLEAYQITKNADYARVAREIFDYVLRDMRHPQGGFYSAEDADSFDPNAATDQGSKNAVEKKEGAFYVWRMEEIIKVLGRDRAEIFAYHFGMTSEGNARHDPHGEFAGKNIIAAEKDFAETSRHLNREVSDVQEAIRSSYRALYEARNSRPRPHLDDKVLADWNGLMISSLAFGAMVLDEPRYQQAAEDAAQFIIKNMINEDGRLLHRYRDGEAAIIGTVEDYALFIHGLLDLYEAGFDLQYLKRGIALADDMVKYFWDEKADGFYFTAYDAKELLLRRKEIYDGAIPSGNAVAALDLVRLFHLTLDERWEMKAKKLFKAFAGPISARPSGYAQMMSAFDFASGPSREIIIAADIQKTDVEAIIKEIYACFIPRKVILLRTEENIKGLFGIAPFIEGQGPLKGLTTVYVCEDFMCKLPVQGLERFKKFLDETNENN